MEPPRAQSLPFQLGMRIYSFKENYLFLAKPRHRSFS